MSSSGFVDLRLNEGHAGEDSFWPSFTDIMMVIVLIFLLAMITLLMKNMDLVHQLRASLDAQRAATAQAHSTTDINTQLNKRLKRLEEEAAMLSMRLMNLGEEHSHTLAQLSSSEQQNAQLKSSLAAITQQRDTALSAKLAMEQKQAQLTASLALQTQKLAEQQQQFKIKLAVQQQQYQAKLAEQQRLYFMKVDELGQVKSSSESQLERMKKLELEYVNLETKYNRLIRPARSPLGKVVVLVRYRKLAGKLSIEIKGPADSEYQRVSGAVLHTRLSGMQSKHGKRLYVRII
ncbi:MAG: hypothetical protein Q9M82_04530, partial [Mariprofundus sp.]|nr:hypothetical protein [Mariprofundus sp.]